jgi:hypothetical protein
MKKRCLVFVAVCMLALPSLGSAATELSGTVLEERSGQPLDANVILYKQGTTGEWDYAGSRTTDAATGKFKITFLPAGTYFVETVAANSTCTGTINYCADRYLPQLYNNLASWDFEHVTKITLKDGDTKELDKIRLKLRPFYFDTVANPCQPAGANGIVKIIRKVMNNTGHEQWMLFWGVVDSPSRTDFSDYYDLQASYSFVPKWKLLKPGANNVSLTYKTTPTTLKGKYNYWIIGGDSNLLPMTPYLAGTFCNGVLEDQGSAALSLEDGAARNENPNGPTKIMPTRISADGAVLERGPLPW